MKAEIIEYSVFEDCFQKTEPVRAIFIHGAFNNTAITFVDGRLDVIVDFQRTNDCKIIREVEIPDGLVDEAIKLAEMRIKIGQQFREFLSN